MAGTGTFNYSNPRVIHWGSGSIAQLKAELPRFNIHRIALVTTQSLTGSLDRLGVEATTTAVIDQHTPMWQIDSAVEDAATAKVDGIVSYGGGSAIDAAKIISVRLVGSSDDALPHIAVPTTLSVAELAPGAGYTDDAGDKMGMRDPRLLVARVIYDAELTLATPMQLWLSTGIRALDHAVEGFLADGEHPFNDVMALEAMRRLFTSLPRAMASPEDLEVRTQNQLAAWFSYTLPGPSAGGLGHMMGKQIGARHDIPHGVTSCLLLPHVMRFMASRMPGRMAVLDEVIGSDAPGAVYRLIESLGLPQHIAAFGIGEPELSRAAGEVAGKYPAGDLLQIYLSAL
jgi:alcohol dehydrogenase class IV